jgi:hypothetical protein
MPERNDKMAELADGVETCGDLEGYKEKERVGDLRMPLNPIHRGTRGVGVKRHALQYARSADSNESADQDVCWIVKAQINARQANDNECVEQGENSGGSRDEVDRHGKRKKAAAWSLGNELHPISVVAISP